MDKNDKRVYARSMVRCYCSMMRTATRRVGAIYDEALAPLGINIAQYSLLRTIERLQPVSFTELGRIAELDRSTIGRNVRVLERMGLVATERGEKDQRETVVCLGVCGAELLVEARPLWDDCQREIEARLGQGKAKALREIVGSL